MTDYISREALLSATNGYDWQAGLKTVLKRIPSADVRPVVRGKWTLFGKRGIYGVMYECSACHAKYDGLTSFCPNCGARMLLEPPKEE